MNNCEPVTDERLVAESLPAGRVLLLGCSLCANFGYCVHRDASREAYGVLVQPSAVAREMDRLRALFGSRGVPVRRKTTLSLCSVLKGTRRRIARAASDCDAIVCLSCDEGRRMVESFVPNRPVIAAMRNRGTVRMELFRWRGRTYIDTDTLVVNGRPYVEGQPV